MEKELNLTEVKDLGEARFEISFRRNGVSKKVIVTNNRHFIDDIEDYISTVTSDDPEFYQLWGNPKFRKEASREINKLLEVSELQPA